MKTEIAGLVTTVVFKVTDIENQIPDIFNLATKTALDMKAIGIENETPYTRHVLNTEEFIRLTKISFDRIMKEVEKSPASKAKVKHCLDLGDQNICSLILEKFLKGKLFLTSSSASLNK